MVQVCKALYEAASSPLLWRHRLAEDLDVRHEVRSAPQSWEGDFLHQRLCS